MIYITGDTHSKFERFKIDNFKEQKDLTRNDLVIICGDFGGIFKCQDKMLKEEEWWLDWLENKSYTTLFIDGNHENFDRLNEYPVKNWNGGKVHVIRPHVLHLMRGQVFTLENKTFFTFGGAASHDIKDGILEKDDKRINKWRYDYSKLFRINKVSWWKEEMPSQKEMDEGIKNLEENDFKVDYILTHSPFTELLYKVDKEGYFYKPDILTDYLQKIKEKTQFHQWIFGHLHINQNFYEEKAVCLYEQIIRLI